MKVTSLPNLELIQLRYLLMVSTRFRTNTFWRTFWFKAQQRLTTGSVKIITWVIGRETEKIEAYANSRPSTNEQSSFLGTVYLINLDLETNNWDDHNPEDRRKDMYTAAPPQSLEASEHTINLT